MQKLVKWFFMLGVFSISTHIFADIDLELSMTANKTNVKIYENVTYTLSITNNGDETATGIGVEFPLPQNTAYTGSTTSKGTYVHWTNTWSINSLAVGETVTMDLIAFTLHATNIRMAFAEVVAADQTDSDSTPANNTVNYPVEDDEAQASALGISQTTGDLRLSLSTNQTKFSVGDLVIYTLLLYNDSPNKAGPIIVDVNLPDGLKPTAFGGYGFFDAQTRQWVVRNDIEGNEIYRMEIYTEVVSLTAPSTAFFEIAAATNPDSDSTPNNDNGDFTADEDDEVVSVIEPYTGPSSSDLELRVNINTYPATSTSEASFEAFIILDNKGPANNKEITVNVELPEGISDLEYTNAPQSAYYIGEDWYLHFLPSGGQRILLITGVIADSTVPLTFYAEVKEAPISDPDSTPDNNSTQIPVEDDEGAFTIPPSNGTRPDLEANILEVTPIAVQAGETFDVQFQVKNVRGVAAPASEIHIWVDDEQNFDPYYEGLEFSFGIEGIPALGVGEVYTATKTYTIPNHLLGEYWMYVKADSDDKIDEDIEENVEIFFRKITVGGTSPNLYFRNTSIAPNELAPGTPITINSELGNNGVAAAPSNTVKYYFSDNPSVSADDIFIATEVVPALGVGETVQLSQDFVIPIDLVGNFHYIIIVADADNEIEEEYETDNKVAILQYIEDLNPDLYLPKVQANSISQNTKLNLYATVANGGFAASPATTIDYYLSTDATLDGADILLGDGLVPAIEVGEEATNLQQVFDIPPSSVPYGEYYVFFEVNPNQNFEEGYFGDNIAFTRFTHVAPSNSTEEFDQYFGTGKGVRVQETNSGYQILGTSLSSTIESDVIDVQTDEFGTQTSYSNFGAQKGKIIRTADGGYVQVSTTGIPFTGENQPSDIEVTKRGSTYSLTWSNTYSLGEVDYGTDIHQTSDGGYVITGHTDTKELFIYEGIEYERNVTTMIVLRIDANGNELWFNEYPIYPFEEDFNFQDQGMLITQTNDGNFVVLTLRNTPSPSAPPGLSFTGRDIRIYKISASGDMINAPEYGYGNQGTYYFPSVLKPTSDGGYIYVTGWQVSSSKAGQNAVVEKVGGTNGSWSISRSTSQFGTARFNNVLENDEGNFITMGIYQPFNSVPQHLFHVQADGTEFDDFDIDRQACDMIQTSDGGYALTGIYNDQIFLKKIPDGDISTEGVDIELEYTVNAPTYRQWQKVNYTLTATNTGTEAATNLVISDPIPFGMAFTSKTVSTGTYNLWHQTWTIPQLAAGETATLNLTLFTLINNATIVKFAQVKSLDQMDTDSTPNNNNTTIPQEDDETAVSISPIGGGSGKDVLDNPIAQSGALKLYNLFPVPADDNLNIVFGTGGFQVNVLLYDVNGRLLEQKSLRVNQGENALEWDVSHLSAGFYTISIETPEGYVRGKFLKN